MIAPYEEFPIYKRSPRIVREAVNKKIEIQAPKEKRKISTGSLLSMLLPPIIMVCVTIAISVVMKRGMYVLMSAATCLLTIVTSIMRYVNDKKSIREDSKAREETYVRYLLKKRKEAFRAYTLEQEIYRYNNPTLKEIQQMVEEGSPRIYERNSNDGDFLNLCIGTEKTKPCTEIVYKTDELKPSKDELEKRAELIVSEYQTIDKPVFVDLKKSHLGIVGSRDRVHEILKAYIMQITFFHTYHDVEIFCVCGEENKEFADRMHMLRHMTMGEINCRLIVSNERSRDQILGSLNQILRERHTKSQESKKESRYLPHYLIIIDDPKLIMDHSVMEYLQKDTHDLGFSIIYCTSMVSSLPENIGSVLRLEEDKATLLLNEKKEVNSLITLPETSDISDENLEWFARNLGAYEHVMGVSSAIPDSLGFLQMYEAQTPKDLHVEQKWKKNDATKSLAVPLGARAQGDIVYLNLHEKAHGPHGLVAGTTGSGKSETLQSYILSLAVNFSPYDVAFLLIDYKGGGMASLFKDLPHLLGVITNLDGNESMRALLSIKSELNRRQNIFNEYEVNHINNYSKLFKTGVAKEPMPHLFIISDEFAQLKKEQPEFMKELVATARIGRSLGVHLILATQKPSGVVDDQIWSNSRFKLALKVQDEADSREILKTGDAASITKPGRAYLQVGNNEIYELFQSAYSGGDYVESEKEREQIDNRVYVINELGQGELVNEDLSGLLDEGDTLTTQLDAVVDYIRNTYDVMGLEAVRRPWLEPLSEKCIRQEKTGSENDGLKVRIGLIDKPQNQLQEDYVLDFEKDGNLICVATSGFGKTFLLTSIMLELCGNNSVDELNVYLIDFGNSGLMPLNRLGHVADYITFDDTERMGKLQLIIRREMKRRRDMLAMAGAPNLSVYKQMGGQCPEVIFLVIDNYDVVKELGAETEEFFQTVSRDGAGLGIYMIATANRTAAVKYATMSNLKNKLLGFVVDPGEGMQLLNKGRVEVPMVKGRMALKEDNDVNMLQVYSPIDYETSQEYVAGISALVENINTQNGGRKAIRIPVLPTTLDEKDLNIGRFKTLNKEIFLGLTHEEVIFDGFDSNQSPFVIMGEGNRGKTNALKLIVNQMINQQRSIYLFDSRKHDLQKYAKNPMVRYVDTEEKMLGLLEIMKATVKELKEKSNADALALDTRSFSIVIDDLDYYIETVGNKVREIAMLMQALSELGLCIVITVNSSKFKGFDEMSKFARTAMYGLLLGSNGGSSLFALKRLSDAPKQGDGLLFENGEYKRIKVMKAEE